MSYDSPKSLVVVMVSLFASVAVTLMSLHFMLTTVETGGSSYMVMWISTSMMYAFGKSLDGFTDTADAFSAAILWRTLVFSSNREVRCIQRVLVAAGIAMVCPITTIELWRRGGRRGELWTASMSPWGDDAWDITAYVSWSGTLRLAYCGLPTGFPCRIRWDKGTISISLRLAPRSVEERLLQALGEPQDDFEPQDSVVACYDDISSGNVSTGTPSSLSQPLLSGNRTADGV